MSLKLRDEEAVGPGVASASETALSAFFFLPFLLFLETEDPRGPSFPVAIPIVTSLPALIPGAVSGASSSLRPGIGLCVTRAARAQREGAARSGRSEGWVPWRRPKERDISCSRMDWSRRRMCLSTFRRASHQGLGGAGGRELDFVTYRVIDGLRESDFFLRSTHDLIH